MKRGYLSLFLLCYAVPVAAQSFAAAGAAYVAALPVQAPASPRYVQAPAAPPDTLVDALRWGHAALQAADLGTTEYLMGRELQRRQDGKPTQFREGNPLMRGLVDRPVAMAAAKIGYAVGLDWILRKLDGDDHRHLRVISGTVAAMVLESVVIVRNQQHVRQAQRAK